jgi:hypothetical protein
VLRKRAIAAALTVVCASLIWTIWATGAVAAPTEMTVRVEGKEGTLFEGPVLTEGHDVQAASDTQPRRCDGTNNNAHRDPMATPTAAAVDAMEMTGQAFDATWFDGFDDYYVTQFGPDHEDLGAAQYWGILVNGVFTPVGGCQFGDRAGDEALWVYDAFSARKFLWLAAASDPTAAPRTPLPTAYVEVGQPLALLVESYEGGGAAPTRAEGITVAPVATAAGNGVQTVEVGSPEAVTTAADGSAEITFSTPGWHRIKAQKEAGFIRSNRLDVCVEPAGGGGCGAIPADAQLRVPEKEGEGGPEGGGGTPGGDPKGGGKEEEERPAGQAETPKPSGDSGVSKPTPTSAPSNDLTLSRAAVDTRSASGSLSVVVPGPGTLTLAGKKVVGRSVAVAAAGTVELTIEPTAREAHALHRRGKLRVGFKVSFTPSGGATASQWRSVLLRSATKPS